MSGIKKDDGFAVNRQIVAAYLMGQVEAFKRAGALAQGIAEDLEFKLVSLQYRMDDVGESMPSISTLDCGFGTQTSKDAPEVSNG